MPVMQDDDNDTRVLSDALCSTRLDLMMDSEVHVPWSRGLAMTQLHIDVWVVRKHHIYLADCEYHRSDYISCTQLLSFRLLSLEHHIRMALNPRFAGQRFVAAANAKTLHTLELCEIVSPCTMCDMR
jgi:hypothetical protein